MIDETNVSAHGKRDNQSGSNEIFREERKKYQIVSNDVLSSLNIEIAMNREVRISLSLSDS